MRLPALLPMTVLTVLLAGCNGPAGETYDIERTVDLAIGGGAEVNLIMTKGDSFTATFNATGPLFWDVHSHAGRSEVVTHQSGTDANGTLEFTAPSDDVFSIYWRNNQTISAVELVYVVDGDGSIHSITPAG